MTQNQDLLRALRDTLRPGASVFVHAGPAEPPALRAALLSEPVLAAGLTVTGVFVPGLNDFDYAAMGARVRTSFVPASSRPSFEAGRHELLPLHYSDLTRHFAGNGCDLAILHCPPDRDGRYSLGLNADFARAAAGAARRTLVIANPHLPWTAGHDTFALRDGDRVVADGRPPLSPSAEEPDAISLAVAAQVAPLVRDGDTLQIGIGKVPAAILRLLDDRRGLGIHSGIVTGDVLRLVETGTLDIGREGALVTGSAWGGPDLHALVGDPRVTVASAARTHDLRRIAAIPRFLAVNSAIEVDLLGQVNGEIVRGRRVSGIGGANDFARGARMAPGGRSIVALPSTAGRHSRIVPLLGPGSVSQAAPDADIVATEHGIAALRDLPLDARAEALTALAAPEHWAALAESWRDIRARM